MTSLLRSALTTEFLSLPFSGLILAIGGRSQVLTTHLCLAMRSIMTNPMNYLRAGRIPPNFSGTDNLERVRRRACPTGGSLEIRDLDYFSDGLIVAADTSALW